MGRLNKRALIQQILTERGYTDWCVVELRKIDSGNSAVECILFNFREGRKAELVIPHHWFQDACPLIGESIVLAIQDSREIIVQSAKSTQSASVPNPLTRSFGGERHFSVSDLFHLWAV
jgi:hypothetical protein